MISVNCKYNYIISSQWAVGTTIYVVKGLPAYSSPPLRKLQAKSW